MHLFTGPAHYLKNGNFTTCLIIKNWCVEILTVQRHAYVCVGNAAFTRTELYYGLILTNVNTRNAKLSSNLNLIQ